MAQSGLKVISEGFGQADAMQSGVTGSLRRIWETDVTQYRRRVSLRRVSVSEYAVVAVEDILSRFVRGTCVAVRDKDNVRQVFRGGWAAVAGER